MVRIEVQGMIGLETQRFLEPDAVVIGVHNSVIMRLFYRQYLESKLSRQ